jgi:hypothetical protein
MSDEDFGFAPPPFRPDEALQKLGRELRALGLAARGDQFEHRGQAVAKVALVDGQLQAAMVRRPGRSPEWQTRTLTQSAQLRDFVAELKKRMAAWTDRDD